MLLTQNFNLTGTSPAIRYGTTPPASLVNTSGAVSPLGWPIGFFDDFTSWTQSNTSDLASTDATTKWYCLVDNSKFLLNIGGEQEFYCNPFRTPACNPFSHSGSVLTITASNPTSTQLASIQACSGYNAANYTGHYGPVISGAFHSGQVYKSTYGYYEINCTQPIGPGCWTAFWIPDPSNSHQPHEMDFMEQVSGTRIGSGVLTLPSGGCYSSPTYADAGTVFHTYAGLWTPNYVAFYFDGALIHTCPPSYTGALGSLNIQFITNFAIGGLNGAGYATAADLPRSWKIDWIRCSVLGPA